jgi:hypothetical protein
MDNKITGIIAPKGTGKTHYACSLLSALSRVAVFDIVQEAQYAQVCDEIIFASPRLFARAISEPTFRVAYRTTSIEEGFEHFVALAYLRGDLTIVVEEADQVCSPYYLSENFNTAIQVGRHRSLNTNYITRSFSGIHRHLTRNTNEFVFFSVIEPRDLDGIADRCGTEVAERVRELRRLSIQPLVPGERLIWKDTGEWRMENVEEIGSEQVFRGRELFESGGREAGNEVHRGEVRGNGEPAGAVPPDPAAERE